MAMDNMGVSLGENRDLLRGVCVEKDWWHNSKQDGSGVAVCSKMVFIPRFAIDTTKMPSGIPSGLNGQEFGGFWMDKYTCSQPNATPTDAYPDVVQDGAPGLFAGRSQQGVPPWCYITWDEAKLACENRGSIVTGTADSGTTTTLVDAPLPATRDKVYVGWRLKITAGTNVGEARKVTNYVASTKTITVDRAFSGSIDATSVYRLTQFHLITPKEWAALTYWSVQNGTMPRGNNNSGADIDFPAEKCIADPTVSGRGLVGTGPPTWSHNHTNGVHDLNGNVWNWCDLKINAGVISEVNGDTAHPAVGKAVPAAAGYVAGISSDSELMLLAVPTIGSSSPAYGQDYYSITITSERAARRGGGWTIGAEAGVVSLVLTDTPTGVGGSLGFRAALSVI